MLTLKLFGSPTVLLDGTPITTFRSAKSVALLAYLVMQRQAIHPRSALATLLWSEQREAIGRKNLTQTLRRLRADLGDGGKDSRYFETTRKTIGLHDCSQEAIGCDVAEFDKAMAHVNVHTHADIAACADCQPLLEKAVGWATGELLAGFEVGEGAILFEEWLLLQRERLHEQRLAALYALTAGKLAAGEYGDAIRFAREQIALESWREKAHRQLIEAFVQNGEREAAVAQLERCREILAEELGVAVSAETEAALHTHALPPHNLPETVTPFVGRQHEIDQIVTRIVTSDYRLITLVGQGGIGKTRLALEVGRRMIAQSQDGVYFVSLTGIDSAENIPLAVVDALGLSIASRKSVRDQLFNWLQSRRVLLILDNFEHLLAQEAATDFVHQLLGATSGVQLLVTSRAELGLLAEDLFVLHGLALPTATDEAIEQFASVQLFLDRARRAEKRFVLSAENRAAVLQICRLLDGLPLGIELATSWVRRRSLTTIAAAMTDSFDAIATRLRDVEPRHRSLRAVFDYSWQLLDAPERQLLAQLATFRGGFSEQAVQAVTGSGWGVLDQLVAKSLVMRGRKGRYTLHELVRQFSAEKPAPPATIANYSRIFLTQITDATVALDSPQRAETIAQLRPDLDNIRKAWQCAVADERWQLLADATAGTVRFLFLIGAIEEARTLCATTHQAAQASGHVELSAQLQSYHAWLLAKIKDNAARAVAQAALTTATDSPFLTAFNHATLFRILAFQGKETDALRHADIAAKLAAEHQLVAIEMDVEGIHGWLAYVQNRFEEAHTHYERVLAMADREGASAEITLTIIGDMGNLAADEGALEQSLAYHERHLRGRRRIGDLHGEALGLHWLACTQDLLGLYEPLVAGERLACDIFRQTGDSELESFAQHGLASGLMQLGYLDEAAVAAQRAVTLAQQHETVLASGFALYYQAAVRLVQKQYDAAATSFRHALEKFEKMGDQLSADDCTAHLAYIVHQQGDLDGAMAMIRPIIAQLKADPATQTRNETFWRVHQVTQTGDPATAAHILKIAQAKLTATAEQITTPALRESFLYNVSANRALMAQA